MRQKITFCSRSLALQLHLLLPSFLLEFPVATPLTVIHSLQLQVTTPSLLLCFMLATTLNTPNGKPLHENTRIHFFQRGSAASFGHGPQLRPPTMAVLTRTLMVDPQSSVRTRALPQSRTSPNDLRRRPQALHWGTPIGVKPC